MCYTVAKLVRSAFDTHSSVINLKSLMGKSSLRYYSNYGDDDGDPPCILTPTDSKNPNEPTIYDARKYGHCLPADTVCPYFELLMDIPSGVFRCTDGEMLGYGAGKCNYYKNPEYFSYQHMSYYDFHLHLRKYRLPCPPTMRKPP